MILIDFLAMILLYAVHTVIQPVKKEDSLGEILFIFLAGFGFLFLALDVIEKIKGLF
jgi:hypothetical protein